VDPIFDFSAAPHLPLSLRVGPMPLGRPDCLLCALMDASTSGADVRVMEQDGEIFIEFSMAA
jgi:hypothetical protein